MKTRLTHPLISCICITAGRPEMLLRAISCFEQQRYPNRELVISYPENDLATRSLLDRLVISPELNILRMERAEQLPLGTARNEAVAASRGEYCCTWDDDDWYHPFRIIQQHDRLITGGKRYGASMLTEVLLYDQLKDQAYYSFRYPFAGTLLCRRDLLLAQPYEASGILEDRFLVPLLKRYNLLLEIDQSPYLYYYTYNGRNVLDQAHFSYFVRNSSLLDEESREWIRQQL